jgi:hypothetical protein
MFSVYTPANSELIGTNAFKDEYLRVAEDIPVVNLGIPYDMEEYELINLVYSSYEFEDDENLSFVREYCENPVYRGLLEQSISKDTNNKKKTEAENIDPAVINLKDHKKRILDALRSSGLQMCKGRVENPESAAIGPNSVTRGFMERLLDRPLRVAVNPNELILKIAFHSMHKPNLVSQEFLVLGSQKLSDLRDMLYCLSDRVFDDEEKRKNRFTPAPDCKAYRQGSAFFFMEGVFYNDMREPDAEDYSIPIREWVKCLPTEKKPFEGQLEAKSMASVTFNEINLRINHPYLYTHCGNCEHIITVKDIRMLHPSDPQNFELYPLRTYFSRVRRKRCRMCDDFAAAFVTVGDENAPENPCVFCEYCFDAFHNDENGQRLYDNFKVFRYTHE